MALSLFLVDLLLVYKGIQKQESKKFWLPFVNLKQKSGILVSIQLSISTFDYLFLASSASFVEKEQNPRRDLV